MADDEPKEVEAPFPAELLFLLFFEECPDPTEDDESLPSSLEFFSFLLLELVFTPEDEVVLFADDFASVMK